MDRLRLWELLDILDARWLGVRRQTCTNDAPGTKLIQLISIPPCFPRYSSNLPLNILHNTLRCNNIFCEITLPKTLLYPSFCTGLITTVYEQDCDVLGCELMLDAAFCIVIYSMLCLHEIK